MKHFTIPSHSFVSLSLFLSSLRLRIHTLFMCLRASASFLFCVCILSPASSSPWHGWFFLSLSCMFNETTGEFVIFNENIIHLIRWRQWIHTRHRCYCLQEKKRACHVFSSSFIQWHLLFARHFHRYWLRLIVM